MRSFDEKPARGSQNCLCCLPGGTLQTVTNRQRSACYTGQKASDKNTPKRVSGRKNARRDRTVQCMLMSPTRVLHQMCQQDMKLEPNFFLLYKQTNKRLEIKA